VALQKSDTMLRVYMNFGYIVIEGVVVVFILLRPGSFEGQ
jgi:hypothetical protein